ncbi:MAG: NUDIX domain-containing protein [Bacteroidia bacterium]|nr:NUDIX domain-containing protein [Bacteroidia bacterium]MDW8089764.1 NUDIX domain-containing protein [Bacteroidia bacterium]
MLRVYHYDCCLEFSVITPGLRGLPTTQVLPHQKSPRLLYLPGTMEKIRQFHLTQTEGHCVIYFPSAEAINLFWESYRRGFENIPAAGAVVMDAGGLLLFIWRRGRWDLPKGKQEEHESPDTTAQRELYEETGLAEVQAERFLTYTYHIYADAGKVYLKQVAWYLFRCLQHRPPVSVQKEEGIQDYRWVRPEEVPFLYPQSYGTIREVIEYVLREVLSASSQ